MHGRSQADRRELKRFLAPFLPLRELRDVRELLRYRASLVVDRGVRIQAWISHDAVDKVINNGCDALDTAKAIIKTWLILGGHGIPSSKVFAICHATQS